MKQIVWSCLIVLALATPSFVVAQTPNNSSSPEKEFTVPVVKSWISRQYEKMEIFRKKQEVYFVAMRDELKETLKIDQKPVDKIIDIGIAGKDDETPQQAYSTLDNPLDYGKYIFATAMATAFSNPLLFYVATLLLAFIVLKFIVRMVV